MNPKLLSQIRRRQFPSRRLAGAVINVKLKYLDAWTAGAPVQRRAPMTAFFPQSGLLAGGQISNALVRATHIFNQLRLSAQSGAMP